MAKNREFVPVEGSDEELIANARMLSDEYQRIIKTLNMRGIEERRYTYDGGKWAEVEFERVTREKL